MRQRLMPVTDAASQPWWDAAREHRLLLQRCAATGRYQWYPRAHSLHAPSNATPNASDPQAALQWVESNGLGTVFSFSVIHRGGFEDAPYVCALIELEERVLMLSRVEEITPDDVRIGLEVEVRFRDIDDTLTLPVFVPRENS